MKLQHQADETGFHAEGFLKTYQERIRETVIPYQYEILNDRVPGAAKSHAIQNFVNAGKALRGETDHDDFYGMVFQDSDVAKWLEAVAHSLTFHPDPKLEAAADAVIDAIAGAQDADGYLNTYYTVKDKDKRWTDLLEGHELYCAGHMMEAAVAYYEATGKRKLLDVMCRNADHIYRRFITEGKPGYPGHPEVELALLKLSRAAKEPKYTELAKHFIDLRGADPAYFENEAKNRDWSVWGNDGHDRDYQQSARPVREQRDAVGHAVRAAYLYTAMADLAAETGDESLLAACRTLWGSVAHRRMYVTGAIGSAADGEAFTADYDLPNDTAYAETCASIGLMFFASRMLEAEAKGEYADVMEQAFYNTVLAGMQLDGKRFFYVNPLEVVPGISGVITTHKHVLPERPAWYDCACCPPNAARLICSLGRYAYGENADTAFCHLYAAGRMDFRNGISVQCETEYPYGFTVTYRILSGSGKLAVRIPGWSEETECRVNGRVPNCAPVNGYLYLPVQSGDTVEIELDDRVQRLYADPRVAADSGMVCFRRGGLVYCAEGADNSGDVLGLSAKEDGEVTVLPFDPALLGGVTPIEIEGYRTEASGALYTARKPKRTPCTIRLIPYYAWGNRGENQMRVWLPERA